MAVTKFVRAQDILKEKGFKAPPFDTAGFQNAVVEFFQKNDVSAKLIVASVRFIEFDDAPQSGFVVAEEKTLYREEPRSHYSRKGNLIYDEPEIVYFKMHKIPIFLTPYITQYEETDVDGGKYIYHPAIFVDEPYATNAVGLLKMAGFIVSRKYNWKGFSAHTITLV